MIDWDSDEKRLERGESLSVPEGTLPPKDLHGTTREAYPDHTQS